MTKRQKKILKVHTILWIFIFIFCGIGKTNAQICQRNIGELETGFGVSDIEKVIGKKIIATEDSPVKIKYNGMDIHLEFTHFEEDENGRPIYELMSMSTSSKKFKTDSGLGVGSTMKEVLQVYEKYRNKTGFNLITEQENEVIVFETDYMNIITYQFKNDKVIKIKIYEADSW
jgi:hypothetical protein